MATGTQKKKKSNVFLNLQYTIQCNTMQCNTRQYNYNTNTIQYNTNTIQYNTIPTTTTTTNTTQRPTQRNAIQHNTTTLYYLFRDICLTNTAVNSFIADAPDCMVLRPFPPSRKRPNFNQNVASIQTNAPRPF